jgi:lipoprotein-anchoring transpeptidase ErfK/SrfK
VPAPSSLSGRARAGAAAGAALLVVLIVAAVVWVSSDDTEPVAAPITTTTTEAATTTSTEPEGPEPYRVAQATVDPIEIFAEPGAAEPERTISGDQAVTRPDQTPMVFLIKDRPADAEWLEVYLPVRPNGSSGFVRADDVVVTLHDYRIEVELTGREIRVYDGDELLVEHPVGVGRQDRPTPGGVYYIKELLQPPDPNGVYGTYAYGLSGFSNVLETFAGGEAVIGIHGTNDPSSIGQEVSSGCIRLPNEVIDEMVTYLPLGTPVEILA